MMARFLIYLFILLGVTVNNSIAIGDESLDPMRSPRVTNFRNRVGYDLAITRENQKEQVLIDDWSSLPCPSELKNWQVKTEVTADETNVNYVRIDFTNGEEQINVSVDLFPAKQNRATEYLLIKANSVTTMDIRDERGPDDLGTFSLTRAARSGSMVYWVYRNALAEISTYKTRVSAISVARWLQEQLKSHVQPYTP